MSMSRSIWKGPFSSLKEFTASELSKNSQLNVWSRHSMILPKDIGKQLKIYNGKTWVLRTIVENMVGHKFGEFSPTKKKVIHKVNKKKQISKKK